MKVTLLVGLLLLLCLSSFGESLKEDNKGLDDKGSDKGDGKYEKGGEYGGGDKYEHDGGDKGGYDHHDGGKGGYDQHGGGKGGYGHGGKGGYDRHSGGKGGYRGKGYRH